MRPLELAAHITILVLVCIGVGAAIYFKWTRQRQKETEEKVVEEAHVRTTSGSLDRVKPISSDLPLFKTRSSLSMSSSPAALHAPKTLRSPVIKFTLTPPGRRSRKDGSMDGLPSVETVLEQYEREADAAKRSDNSEHDQILTDQDLGEPGPCVVEEEAVAAKKSVWDRPHITERAAKEA